MKRIINIFQLSVIIMALSSCSYELGGPSMAGEYGIALNSEDGGRELNNTFGPYWSYYFSLSFFDSKGNDLVAQLAEERWTSNPNNPNWSAEINPERYHLDVIYSNLPDGFNTTTYTSNEYYGMIPVFHGRYFSLSQQANSAWCFTYDDGTYIKTWGEEV